MLNILFVIEDLSFAERLKPLFNDSKDIIFHFANNAEDAVAIIDTNIIALAFMSLSVPVMNGDELSEYILAKYSEARLIFLFENHNFELAIDMFNRYDGSRVLSKNQFKSDNLKKVIANEIDIYTSEDKLKSAYKAYREREKTYKSAMNEISSVLNNRVESYSHITNVFKNAYVILEDNNSMLKHRLSDFYSDIMNRYINYMLIEPVSGFDNLSEFEEKYNDKEQQRHFKIVDIPDANVSTDNINRISFSVYALTSVFCEILEKYRIKAEFTSLPNAIKMDFFVDIRFGNIQREYFDSCNNMISDILSYVTDKNEKGFKDGILQYRLFWLSNN